MRQLNTDEIIQLAKGRKVKLKAVRGKARNTELNFDRLAGAIAVICNSFPNGISTSRIYTMLMDQKFYKKLGKNISRNMVSARINKLWAIGHVHKKKEPIMLPDGTEESFRYIFYQGEEEEAPMSATQQELVLNGRFAKQKIDRMFRSAYSLHKPQNRFEEAIFDIITDNTDMQFPISLEEYRRQVSEAFTEEIGREDRLSQLYQWATEPYQQLVPQPNFTPRDFVVAEARKFATIIWECIKEQMRAHQKLAESGMEFNEAEYKRLTEKDPDYWKSVKEMKKEGKL